MKNKTQTENELENIMKKYGFNYETDKTIRLLLTEGYQKAKQEFLQDEIEFLEEIRKILFKNSQVTFDNKGVIFSVEYFENSINALDNEIELLKSKLNEVGK